MHFILFSGPPGSGKDTAAQAVYEHFQARFSMRWEKFSFPHKRAFAGMMYAQCTPLGVVDPYEKTKDQIIPELGVSYRQWQIDYSEKFMKPLYGNDIFAKLLLARQQERLQTPGYLCVISDCGFAIEVDALAKVLQPNRALLCPIFRPGTSYDGDSREPVRWNTTDQQYEPIHNDKDETAFKSKVIRVAEAWLKWANA